MESENQNRCWWWGTKLPCVDDMNRLEDLCLHAVIKHVKAATIDAGRNSRKKKALRQYFSTGLPISLQNRLLTKAAANLEDPRIIMDLLFMFQPLQHVDLLGKLRYAIHLELSEQEMTTDSRWYPYFPSEPLDKTKLNQLYNILMMSKDAIGQLKEISLATKVDALKMSSLPNAFARAPCLTRVVIIEGADNHILRILGLNCPSIKHLDVTHSWNVTDDGIRNLLLKRPPRQQHNGDLRIMSGVLTGQVFGRDSPDLHRMEKNPCAATLDCIIITGTSLTWQGCNFACKAMGQSYFHALRPLMKITRMKMKRTRFPTGGVFQSILDTVWAVEHSLPVFGALLVEYFEPRNTSACDCFIAQPLEDGDSSLVYVRPLTMSYVCLAFKMKGAQVTSLSLPFYSLNWDQQTHLLFDVCLPLRVLADDFPNLLYFFGRLKGILDQIRVLPRLQKAIVWARSSSTAVSMLRCCPFLKYFEYNHLDIREDFEDAFDVDHADRDPKLTHQALLTCFEHNPSLEENLIEITLRPAINLGMESLSLLINKCRNLKRVGDLKSWNLSKSEIKSVYKNLKRVDGRISPTLSLMNSPPSDLESMQWDSLFPL